MAKKENAPTPFPQSDIDLMFWQYTQGVKDAMKISTRSPEQIVMDVNAFIKAKLVHIHHLHNGRAPSFNLVAEITPNGLEILKTKIQ